MGITAVTIGWSGEKNARQISIPIGPYLQQWPNTTPYIAFTRPTTEEPIFVAETSVVGTNLIWIPNHEDCQYAGRGTANVAFVGTNGNTLGYTPRFTVIVNNTVVTSKEPSNTMSVFGGQILTAADRVIKADARITEAREAIDEQIAESENAVLRIEDAIEDAIDSIEQVQNAQSTFTTQINNQRGEAIAAVKKQQTDSVAEVQKKADEAKSGMISGATTKITQARDQATGSVYLQEGLSVKAVKDQEASSKIGLRDKTDELIVELNTEADNAVSSKLEEAIDSIGEAAGTITDFKSKFIVVAPDEPESEDTKVWIQNDDIVREYTIPEINDTTPSTENTYSSSKIETLLSAIHQRLTALEGG